jgi:hypothetical protein
MAGKKAHAHIEENSYSHRFSHPEKKKRQGGVRREGKEFRYAHQAALAPMRRKSFIETIFLSTSVE